MTSPASLITVPDPIDDVPPRFSLSVHKCGSTMAFRLISAALKQNGIKPVDIESIMWHNGFAPKDWHHDSELKKLVLSGRIYNGFRDNPGIIPDEIGPSIFVARDPRDALTSAYFSFGPKGSHVTPAKNKKAAEKMLKSRAAQSDDGIDAWVVRNIDRFKRQFLGYRNILPQLKVFHYETILFDKLSFLRDTFEHWKIPYDPSILRSVSDELHFIPETEDPSRHIRKGLPGDHLEKLQTETISQIDQEMAEVYDLFGYEPRATV